MNYTEPTIVNTLNQNCPIIMQERWTPITEKSVPNIKSGYLISTYGRVFSTLSNKYVSGFISCWGYLRVTAQSKISYKERVKFSVHRVMLIEFDKNLPPNYEHLQVNHKDADKSHNFIWNLEWSTSSENSLYAYRDETRGAPNCSEEVAFNSMHNKRSYYSNRIDSIPQETIMEIQMMLNQGIGLLTIQRRTGVTESDIVKIKFQMLGIPVARCVPINRYGEFRLTFTDDQIHAICQYFQDHKNIYYDRLSDLYRECLYELFGIEYDTSLFNAMSRYYKRKYRKDITDLYDY